MAWPCRVGPFMAGPSGRGESQSRFSGCCHRGSGRRPQRVRSRQNDRLRDSGDVTVLFDARVFTELGEGTSCRVYRRPILECAYTVSMLFHPPDRRRCFCVDVHAVRTCSNSDKPNSAGKCTSTHNISPTHHADPADGLQFRDDRNTVYVSQPRWRSARPGTFRTGRGTS